MQHLQVILVICYTLVRVSCFVSSFQVSVVKIDINRCIWTLYLNRIFFDLEECRKIEDELEVSLPDGDYRTKHVQEILKADVGDTLKVGILGIGRTDTGKLTKNNRSGINILIGPQSELIGNDKPHIDLILAVPRPLRLERLLPVVSMIGVSRIVLVDAHKVEKDYFGSHLFRRPEVIRAGLIEGLEIADVDCHVPKLLVRRQLRKFLETELDKLYPYDDYVRLFAHPTKSVGPLIEECIGEALVITKSNTNTKRKQYVLAIGPEGGWSDSEVELFCKQHAFKAFSAGDRILRTDVAVPVLLGLVKDIADQESS